MDVRASQTTAASPPPSGVGRGEVSECDIRYKSQVPHHQRQAGRRAALESFASKRVPIWICGWAILALKRCRSNDKNERASERPFNVVHLQDIYLSAHSQEGATERKTPPSQQGGICCYLHTYVMYALCTYCCSSTVLVPSPLQRVGPAAGTVAGARADHLHLPKPPPDDGYKFQVYCFSSATRQLTV